MIGKRKARDEYADYYREVDTEAPQRERPPRPAGLPWYGHAALLLGLLFAFLGVTWLVAGLTLFEKTLKALIAPTGLVWLCLFVLVWSSLVARRLGLAALALLAWVTLTLGGNAFVAQQLATSLQRPWTSVDVAAMPDLDVIVLLGGGTSTSSTGQAQLAASGDRVMLAARILLANKAQRVICSGNVQRGAGDLTPAVEAKTLLMGLGITEERISLIDGRNTREEMALLAKVLDASGERADGRAPATGLITSAWHMTRAMRLAEEQGIEATALPADFHWQDPRGTPHLLIPGGAHLWRVQLYLHEWLAPIVGR